MNESNQDNPSDLLHNLSVKFADVCGDDNIVARHLMLQDHRPYLAFAAYCYLDSQNTDEHHEGSKLALAVDFLQSVRRPSLKIYTPVYKILGSANWGEGGSAVLDRFIASSYHPEREANYSLILEFIPPKDLESWFMSHDLYLADYGKIAVAMDVLTNIELSEEASAKARRILESFSEIPGRPRMSYIVCMPNDNDHYFRTYVELIADGNLDGELKRITVQLTLKYAKERRKEIREHLDGDNLKFFDEIVPAS
jgi:hypothetical protein